MGNLEKDLLAFRKLSKKAIIISLIVEEDSIEFLSAIAKEKYFEDDGDDSKPFKLERLNVKKANLKDEIRETDYLG